MFIKHLIDSALHLVDAEEDCKKCNNDAKKKKYTYKISKLIIQRNKGKDRKLNIPMIFNREDDGQDVGQALSDVNKI